ncbi:hypothetical protein 00-2425CJIE4_5 [Campylobacter phage CJIE4-3]|nr:hypothetical protein 00-2425CJIE4_5 [Campylobacter phage CJIE4-3]AHN83019.1 hypothetical protein 00-6200CJIE4_6 [Campylobacter phage CJIE4-4]
MMIYFYIEFFFVWIILQNLLKFFRIIIAKSIIFDSKFQSKSTHKHTFTLLCFYEIFMSFFKGDKLFFATFIIIKKFFIFKYFLAFAPHQKKDKTNKNKSKKIKLYIWKKHNLKTPFFILNSTQKN